MAARLIPPPEAGDTRTWAEVLALVGLALAASVYFVLRYGGRWAEADSGLMAQAIRDVIATGQLAPDTIGVYGNGYGYQAVTAAIQAFTGLGIATLQQLVYPIVSAVLVVPAWVLYRELIGSARVATLAVLLLMLVPEHPFAMLRGSHERLDRAFLVIALWLLVRSVRHRGDLWRFGTHAGLLLLTTWALIATNALFGMSLVIALGTALVVTWLARHGRAAISGLARETQPLLGWTAATSAVMVVIFVAFAYPPIAPSLYQLSEVPGRLLVLILSGGGVDPYASVLGAWVSPAAYLALSLADFVVLGFSVVVWLGLGWSWLRGTGSPSLGLWMLWLFYLALAAQGAASIFSDRTGALQGNVQYRVFALFATVAAPVLAVGLARWHPGLIGRVAVAAVVAAAAVSGAFKYTLDPALSNKWIQYAAEEVQSLRWADANQRHTTTWVGPDDRLTAAYRMEVGYPSGDNRWDIDDPDDDVGAFLISNLVAIQTPRMGREVPAIEGTNVVYDNGTVQLYRLTGTSDR